MRTTTDALVIGAGIVGAACAYALATAGVTVRVVDRGFPASGTSRACDGLILFSDKGSAAELDMAKASAALWAKLSDALPMPFHYECRGTIVIAETAEGLNAAREKAARLSAAGIRSEALDRKGLAALEPCLAPDLAGGVLYPDEAQLDPPLATEALLQAARLAGAEFRCDTRVTGLRLDGSGRCVAALTPEGELPAGAIILAAGVWSGELAQSVGLSLPVKPRKGHVLVTAAPPGLLAHPLLDGSYAAAVQSDANAAQVALVAEMTAGGALLLGSSREFAGFDTSASRPIIAAIAARAARCIPSLAHAKVIRSYAGLRPWSPDHLPLIGPVARTPGLFLATGHEGAGIGLAPITGQLIAEWITGGAARADAHAYAQAVRPDRFAL